MLCVGSIFPQVAVDSDQRRKATDISAGAVTHSPRVDSFTPNTGKVNGEVSFYSVAIPVADKHVKAEFSETGGGTLGNLEAFVALKVLGD